MINKAFQLLALAAAFAVAAPSTASAQIFPRLFHWGASCGSCSGYSCGYARTAARSCAPCAAAAKESEPGSCATCFGSSCPFEGTTDASAKYSEDDPVAPCEACTSCEACGEKSERARPVLSTVERLVNYASARRGARLTLDANLCAAARYNSELQAYYCRAGHFAGNCYEIAAEGYTTPEAAVEGWIGSAPHAAILLSRRYSRVGAAVVRGRDGRLYWTMLFR